VEGFFVLPKNSVR
jgi:hypothetical protein